MTPNSPGRREALFFSALAALALTAAQAADITRTLNYQGFLSNLSSGLPISAVKDMQFALYDAVTGGTVLFTDTRCQSGGDGPGIGVSQGRYEVEIGSQTAGRIPASVFEDRDAVWLEVRIDAVDNCTGFEVLVPRIRMQASPYAFKALQASSAAAVIANLDAYVKADNDANATGAVFLQVAGQTGLTVTNGRNVGIGTTLPAVKLHMSSGTLLIDGNAANSFRIGTSSMIVTSLGAVGLGITNPAVKLDVVGGIKASQWIVGGCVNPNDANDIMVAVGSWCVD